MDFNKKNFKIFAIFLLIAVILGVIAVLIHPYTTGDWDFTNIYTATFIIITFIAVGCAVISMIFLWRT